MPSEPNELKLITLCSYLTDVECQWRPSDHTASKMVKALKGDEIKGYFDVSVAGKMRRFTEANAKDFTRIVPRTLARRLAPFVDDKVTLVPIPNSHVIDPDDPDFRTLELAEGMAQANPELFVANPALVFRKPQTPSRRGGPRSPYHFEKEYRIVRQVEGPIVLVDDVCTTGAHFIGACWKLASPKRRILLACAFGRSTKEQSDNPIGVREDTLSLEKFVPDFD